MSSSEASQQKKHEPSEEYIVYPKITAEDNAAPSVPGYETGRWGTFVMGTPSNPQAHPENQQAATWEPLEHGNLPADGDHGSPESEQRAHKQTSTPSSSGYVDPAIPAQGNPYIATTPVSKYSGKGPKEVISDYLTKWSKKFEEISKKTEEMAGNIWQHLKTGPNMADTAWGRLNQGTKLLTGGGFENLFKQTFETVPDEKLRKSYACYLSTSSGPVAGTLYISTAKIAFCSDRPLSYNPSPGQTAWSYYKIVVPLEKLRSASPSSPSPAEKYIQILTVDNHEFWFMGFVNYDKAVKNLQEAPSFQS